MMSLGRMKAYHLHFDPLADNVLLKLSYLDSALHYIHLYTANTIDRCPSLTAALLQLQQRPANIIPH